MHIVINKQINKGYAFLFDLRWLTEEFLPYLDHWEKTVSEREGFSNAEKNMMLFSVNSFVELVQYISILSGIKACLNFSELRVHTRVRST